MFSIIKAVGDVELFIPHLSRTHQVVNEPDNSRFKMVISVEAPQLWQASAFTLQFVRETPVWSTLVLITR